MDVSPQGGPCGPGHAGPPGRCGPAFGNRRGRHQDAGFRQPRTWRRKPRNRPRSVRRRRPDHRWPGIHRRGRQGDRGRRSGFHRRIDPEPRPGPGRRRGRGDSPGSFERVRRPAARAAGRPFPPCRRRGPGGFRVRPGRRRAHRFSRGRRQPTGHPHVRLDRTARRRRNGRAGQGLHRGRRRPPPRHQPGRRRRIPGRLQCCE